MRLASSLSLLALAFAHSGAQILPSRDTSHRHPRLDRLGYYMPRGALLGAGLGILTGLLAPPISAGNPGGDHAANVFIHSSVGAGLGMMAAAVLSNAFRYQPPPPRRRESFWVSNVREIDRYITVGGSLGAGTGLIYALMDRTTPAFLDVFYPLTGWLVGMVAGAATFFLQH